MRATHGQPRSVVATERLGLLAVLVATAGFCASVALSVPMFASADEAAHVDYAYQLWHGRWPVFDDGLVISPPYGVVPPVQWVSQHPPLFYLILAPVVGPLIDADRYLWAGMAARGINIAITVGLVSSIVWAAGRLVPGRRTLALTTGIVAAVAAWVNRVGGAVYNDNLAALLSALLLGVTARAVRSGPRRRDTILIAVLGSLGMLTRASVAIVLALCLVALIVAAIAGPRAGRGRRVRQALLRALVAGSVVLAAAFWFYLRNRELTGRFTGGDPEWSRVNMGRVTRPLLEIVGDPGAWFRLVRFFGHGAFPLELMTTVTVVVPLVLGLVLIRRLRSRGGADAVLLGLGLVLLAATLGQQLNYAASGGQLSPRYLLPVATVPFLLIAHGLTGFARARWLPTAAWLLVVNVQYLDWLRGAIGVGPQEGSGPIFPAAAVTAAAVGLAATVLAVLAADRLRSAPHDPVEPAPAAGPGAGPDGTADGDGPSATAGDGTIRGR